ncbi:MAG: acyl-CoA thioesterase [Deltaproteobacteria bacterium]|nr:acyl-CoA thioesterase [Deltaproteobacteria bacterium]
MGVVYYANYLHMFERGRSELIRSLGLSYATVEERGIFLPVREAQCRYVAPARYDQIVQIRTELAGQGRASLSFAYAIMDENKTAILTRGTTQHAVVDASGKPTRVPAWLTAMFG